MSKMSHFIILTASFCNILHISWYTDVDIVCWHEQLHVNYLVAMLVILLMHLDYLYFIAKINLWQCLPFCPGDKKKILSLWD